MVNQCAKSEIMKEKKVELISKETIVSSFGVKPFLASILMCGMRINKLNRLYRSLLPANSTEELFEKALKKKNIKIDIDQDFFEQIPDQAFVTISNHAFGILDGVSLIPLVRKKQPGYKVTANYLIAQLEPFKELFVPVNPYKSAKSKGMGGTKAVMELLEQNQPVGIFPAGNVATYQKGVKGIVDNPWELSVFRLIKMAKVPIFPLYIRGTNSRMYHFLGRIHPMLRTYRLITEFVNKKNMTVRIEVGTVIQPEDYEHINDVEELQIFFRNIVYELR